MANQPAAPTRQWFRLPTLARPVFTPSPSPPPPATLQKSPSKTTPISPILGASTTTNTVSSSPKPKVPPPSPADSESDAKIPLQEELKQAVMVEKTAINAKPKPRLINGSDSDKNGNTKLLTDEIGRVITLSGDNKGAVMRIGYSPMKNVYEEKSETDSNKWGSHKSVSTNAIGEEVNMKKKEERQKGRTKGWPKMSAFINSNVQGINNSIIYSSSCTGHDPGVHVSLFENQNGGGFLIKDHGNSFKG